MPSRESLFYRHAMSRRVQIGEIRTNADLLRAINYINTTCVLAYIMNIDDFPIKEIETTIDYVSNKDFITEELFLLEVFMNKIWASNVFELEGDLQDKFVIFDDDWRSKISSYISHIRDVVRKASVQEAIRENIFKRLEALQQEVNKNRTRLESFTEALLALTEAGGQAAKHLEPGVRLFERLCGAVARLRKQAQEPAPRQLPPPETLDLPDPDSADAPSEGS